MTIQAPAEAAAAVPPPDEIVYPDSDGQPMADNTLQFRWIVTIEGGLEALFRDRADVFVAGDLLWYPVERHPEIRAAPDALVAFGRPKGERGSYLQWREAGIAPQVVFEVLSPGNRAAELRRKFAFYDRYGVEEYYVFDPDDGRLSGWTRRDGALAPISTMRGWVSPRLGVQFDLDGADLRLSRPGGEPFVSYVELAAQREHEQARADDERRRADDERRRADDERARAERLATKLRELGVDPSSL
jgi:Uma2 family endonuclease